MEIFSFSFVDGNILKETEECDCDKAIIMILIVCKQETPFSTFKGDVGGRMARKPQLETAGRFGQNSCGQKRPGNEISRLFRGSHDSPLTSAHRAQSSYARGRRARERERTVVPPSTLIRAQGPEALKRICS